MDRLTTPGSVAAPRTGEDLGAEAGDVFQGAGAVAGAFDQEDDVAGYGVAWFEEALPPDVTKMPSTSPEPHQS